LLKKLKSIFASRHALVAKDCVEFNTDLIFKIRTNVFLVIKLEDLEKYV